MSKRILTIIFLIFLTTSCFGGAGRVINSETRSALASTEKREIVNNNVQVEPGQVLPPYGVKVLADQASLEIRVSTSKTTATDRLEDIQNAIEQIASLASENDMVTMEFVSVSLIGGSVERGMPESSIQTLDSSAVTLNLTTDLAEQNHDLVKTLVIFDNFLNAIDVSETITVEALSITTEISNTETYRPQLVAKIYQELDAIQQEYGQSVKFGIMNLHGNLQTIQLTNMEYYLYIEPNIIVNEF